jgi:hypothetical protein
VKKLVWIGFLVCLLACNTGDFSFDNLKLEEVRTDLAVPFGTSEYTMRELLEDFSESELELIEDPQTAEMVLIYRDSSTYIFDTEILEITNVVNTNELNIPNYPDDGTTRPVSESIPFTQVYEPVDGETLDSIFHDTSASLRATISSTANVGLEYELELTNTINLGNGQPVTFTGLVDDSAPEVQNQNLTNHRTTFTEVGEENILNFNLTLTGSLAPGEELVNEVITVTVEYLDQEYIIVFGKFGQDTVSVSNEILEIDLCDDVGSGDFEFRDPVLTFDFRNSFGMPFGLGLGGLYGEEPDGSRTFLSGDVVDNPPIIASSSVIPPVTGDPIQTIITVDRSNSNLRQVLATSPNFIGFDLQGFTNPLDDTILNFVTDTSTVRGFLTLELPMEVRFSNVTKELEYDISGTNNFDEADSLAIRVVTVNELPFGADMDMFIMNGNDTLYQALNNRAIDQPFLNQDRTVREPKINVDDIPLGPDGVAAINTGDRILVVLHMNTPESVTSEDIFVKLLANARLTVTLGARGIVTNEL